MPTYDYKCEKCGYIFERFQSMTDKPLKKCPECNGAVKRMIGTGAGIIFKGSGFYQTDYKNACPAGGDKPDSEKSSASCDRCPCGD